MRLLAVNAGSSSVKLSVIEDQSTTVSSVELGPPSDSSTTDSLKTFIADAGNIDAVAHRFVHGGPNLLHTVVIDAEVRQELDDVVNLDPLHLPASLELLDVVTSSVTCPQVACFDTAFHANMPASATTYAIPKKWRDDFGVHRYGFHGLSHAWATRQTAELLERPQKELQIIVAHLGSGSSLCAVRNGISVDTTMGFTPLDGVVMATRSGAIDPGALMWLQSAKGLSATDVNDALEHQSGLLALSGTSDMREVEQRAESGDESVYLARDVLVHSIAKAAGSMAVSLDRIDAITFTGGIGERSGDVRSRVCASLSSLGIEADLIGAPEGQDAILSPDDASIPVVVVQAREDLQMAREAGALFPDNMA